MSRVKVNAAKGDFLERPCLLPFILKNNFSKTEK